MDSYDLVVIGGGAGGTGAALTAARLGMRTLWVERESALGGTGVNALVNVWQPSVCQSSLAEEIAGRLIERGRAIFTAPCPNTPSGLYLYRRVPKATYADTLQRMADWKRGMCCPAVTYEPAAMARLLSELARETGCCDVWLGSTFLEARLGPGADGQRRVQSLVIDTPEGLREVTARWFVDGTADIDFARSAGCAWSFGRESQEEYGEPSAPETPEIKLNGWTLCFLCRPGHDRVALEHEPYGNDAAGAAISQMPWGGFHVNMVFQLPGEVGWRIGLERARELLMGNIVRRWPLVQAAYGLGEYGICRIASRIGVREGPRLRAQYVLTEHDYQAGNWGRHHPDCVAFTDHAIDRHAPDGGCRERGEDSEPMGIPLRCLLPREVENLMVVSRGAGFSSLAASAVRLQRTLIELGEAAARRLASS